MKDYDWRLEGDRCFQTNLKGFPTLTRFHIIQSSLGLLLYFQSHIFLVLQSDALIFYHFLIFISILMSFSSFTFYCSP